MRSSRADMHHHPTNVKHLLNLRAKSTLVPDTFRQELILRPDKAIARYRKSSSINL
jgi:hypothetical protein